MGEQPEKTHISIGLLAHVDAGKTTLSEALLYSSGARRSLGRVDHADAFLDTHALERERGITIFAKQALLSTKNLNITLVDTPGHVDFSAEAQRVMPILDCAILVISGTDGIQAHTLTLWRLLESCNVPVFLFISKMDMAGADKNAVMAQLRSQFSEHCVDFSADPDQIAENVALCDEALLESYLQTGEVTQGNIRSLVEARQLFPCCFGSGLHLSGVNEFLETLDAYAPRPQRQEAFGARVYKITRDAQGNRLTWIKVIGGKLGVREQISYVNQKGETIQEKVIQLRQFSGDRFSAVDAVFPGQTVAVTGLSQTYAGQPLGVVPQAQLPQAEPVMTYRVVLPATGKIL